MNKTATEILNSVIDYIVLTNSALDPCIAMDLAYDVLCLKQQLAQ